jgi:cell division septation protein DedD
VREYDGYAVGRRVLRLAPAWLLLTVAAFVLALLLFSWVGRRGGDSKDEAFRNEATNQTATNRTAATPEGAHAAALPSGPAPASEATPAATAEAQGEAVSYSVQVGAFADISQANEQVSRLRAAGFEARVAESGEATRFRFQVRSGLYATREEAARLASALRAAGVAGETVIVEPQRK